MKVYDDEVWLAMHEDCGPEGCGRCVPVELDWTEKEEAQISAAAAACGESLNLFVVRAIRHGLEKIGADNPPRRGDDV